MFWFIVCAIVASIICAVNEYRATINFRDKYYPFIWVLAVLIFVIGICTLPLSN